MQDRAIAAIGRWQLEEKKDTEPVDLYIENMFPGKDWQILLLVFEINNKNEKITARFIEIDIEKVSANNESYRKYAYRKGSARGGDITFTTKLGFPVDKKIKTIKETTFKNILGRGKEYLNDTAIFNGILEAFRVDEEKIKKKLDELFKSFNKQEIVTTGLSFKIKLDGKVLYLRDFDLIKHLIIEKGSEVMYKHAGVLSKSQNKISSLSGEKAKNIFGFAAPFKYASPDKPGFISGFFNKKLNWRNYPISADETLVLELGRKYIQQNLSGYFYGTEYMVVPHPLLNTNVENLKRIVGLLKTAFDEEKKTKKEKKKKAEDRIQKIIAQEKNYFSLDMLFFKEDKKTQAISIELMLEEILPSRFRLLFTEAPIIVNAKKLFKNAITIKKEREDLVFSFQIVRDFFGNKFLDAVNKIFMGTSLSREAVFENIMNLIRSKYNESKTKDGFVEPLHWVVLKAIMLLSYLHELNILTNNKNYNYMETETNQKHETSFDTAGFNGFIKENESFLDSNIKVGIFAVGVLVRFLFDIQNRSLGNTPFENKLRGYKLNPELLMKIYTEALEKIQKYQSFYSYLELRDIISKYFVVNSSELKKLPNNELSFYFVAGLELGKKFKREK